VEVGQGVVGAGVDVEPHQVAVVMGTFDGGGGQGALEDRRQGIGPGHVVGTGAVFGVGVALAEQGVSAFEQGPLQGLALVGGQIGIQAPATVVGVAEADPAHLAVVVRATRFGVRRSVVVGIRRGRRRPELVAGQHPAQLAHGDELGQSGDLGIDDGRGLAAHHVDLVFGQRPGLERSPCLG